MAIAFFSRKQGIKVVPELEPLEQRALPSSIPFVITINDPTHEFAPFPDLAAAVPIAENALSSLFSGDTTINVEIVPTNQSGRIGGEERGGGSAVSVVTVGAQDGLTVVETVAEAKALGMSPANESAPDILVYFDPVSYLPIAATGPSGTSNMAFAIEHETIHGLGFEGYRSISGPTYGQIVGNAETVYDSLTAFDVGGDPSILYFTGANAEKLYGGPVPLTSLGASATTGENFYHVANPPGQPGDSLLDDLMNGVAFSYRPPSALDLAMLADLGWKLANPLTPPEQPPQVVESTAATTRHHQITSITLTFNDAMDTGMAELIGNYALIQGHKLHGKYRFNTQVAIRSAVYDATNQSVTLTLAKPRVGPIQVLLSSSLDAANGLIFGRTETIRLN